MSDKQLKKKPKCKHPDDKVLTVSGKHQPWEGTCEACGKEVKLTAVKGGDCD